MNSFYILNDAIRYVEDHIYEPITPEDIASACNYSVSNLKYLFQKVFQYGMMDYVNKRKITEAAGRLIQTEETVVSVAYHYGYSSQEVFTRAFYKVWDETPGTYRKNHQFYRFFPMQEFIYDSCKVFRRRFDLRPLFRELKQTDSSIVACFDIIGIRFIKTCFGREAGDAAALKALQRIESLTKRGGHLYRMAGDKFVVNFESSDYETVRCTVVEVLSCNTNPFLYKENTIPLPMFAGIGDVSAKEITEDNLFPFLDDILKSAHKRLERTFRGMDGCDYFRMVYEENSGLYQGFALNTWKGSRMGRTGLISHVPGEETQSVFRLDHETSPVRWNTSGQEYELFFPQGELWYKKTVFDSLGNMVREHYYIIRDLTCCDRSTVTFTLLFLEIVKTLEGKILTLNEGELKEALHDGSISKKDYHFIKSTGESIRNMIEKKTE